MLRKFPDFFWPMLDKPSSEEERELADSERAEIQNVSSISFTGDPVTVLSVCNKIYEGEEQRARLAENKSFNLLLVTVALVPLLTYLESAVWEGKFGNSPKWLSVSMLLIAVAYLAGAAYWALKSVSVRTYHAIGPSELVGKGSTNASIEHLNREILIAAIRNRSGVNQKVSFVIMATKFLQRTVFVFCVLLFIQGGWELGPYIGPQLKKLCLRIG
jgi:hypothetical protein